MNVLIVLHQEHSTPGRVGMMLRHMGHTLDIRRPVLGDPLPATMARHGAAIIYGGPMSANDPDDYIMREIDWIGVPLKAEKPYLGICLGAQMMAKHLGGRVEGHAEDWVEIGYCPIRPTAAGAVHGPWPEQVYQWHREGHTLPAGSDLLATGDLYENQAWRYGRTAHGIQFHPEVTRQTMHRWVISGRHRLTLKGAQAGDDHLNGQILHDPPVKAWLERFLTSWLALDAETDAKAA